MLNHDWMQYVPFFSLITNRPPLSTPIITRIIETVAMSAVAGLVGMYVGFEVIKNDISVLKASIEKIDVKVEQIRHDLYVPRNGR